MKLLNRTLRGFLIYSFAILLIVTPILYLVINNIIINQVDETLQLHKREIQMRLEKLPTDEDVRQWEDMDGEVVVKPFDGAPVEEKITTVDNYRVLTGTAEIKGKLYSIQAQISLVESEDLIGALVWTQVAVLVVLISGMFLINLWNSKTVWGPFYDTLNKLKSFSIENNSPLSLQSSSVSEFNDLNAAIQELTRRNMEAFVSQREFTENAAHEMQTPLAVFQSKLDILLQTKPSLQQAMVLDSLFDAVQRLNRLNKGLLLLAKIENNQYHEEDEVDLSNATKRLTDIEFRGAGFIVKVNAILLDILLSNLISNATRYTTGPVFIKMDKSSWTISNPGEPLSIAPEKMFGRFQKGNHNTDSLGLGLAIARRICDTCKLDLSYSFVNDIHSFSIHFPESKISTNSRR